MYTLQYVLYIQQMLYSPLARFCDHQQENQGLHPTESTDTDSWSFEDSQILFLPHVFLVRLGDL